MADPLTKGAKYDGEKLRYDLIPPEALEELARVFTIGARKYEDRNWEKGINFGRIYAAMLRHLQAWYQGEDIDPEGGQHHLSSVAWGAFALMTYQLREMNTYDDRVIRTRSQIASIGGNTNELVLSNGERVKVGIPNPHKPYKPEYANE